MFQDSAVGEVVLGSELARHLQLNVGDRIPPFYRSSQGERVSHVVGIFRSDTSLWQASLIFTSIEYAAAIFDQPQHITDLLVDCRAGYENSVRDQIRNRVTFSSPGLSTHVRPRVVTREEVRAILPAGLLHREGIFSLHFVVAFAVGILVILVTSGFGLSERRREFGVLKATGWQTDEVLLRGLVESLLLSVIGATLAIIIAFAWLRWFNGYWIAGIFLSGVDAYPHFPIPFRITPMPAVLAAIVSFAIVMTGTLVSTWRSAIVSPMVAMRGG
jgi:ABC-type lipoprotein release transport system permease subunit